MSIPGIGAISYTTKTGHAGKFIPSSKFDRILNTAKNIGLRSYSERPIEVSDVRTILQSFKLRKIDFNCNHQFTWFHAHGFFEIFDVTADGPLFKAIRNVKNIFSPFKHT